MNACFTLGVCGGATGDLLAKPSPNTPEELSAVSGPSDEEEDAYADGCDEDAVDSGDAASDGEAMDFGEDMDVDEARELFLKGPDGADFVDDIVGVLRLCLNLSIKIVCVRVCCRA